MKIREQIILAIENLCILEIDYSPGVRWIEPHTYGLSSERNELLRAYQIKGASASNKPIAWKLFSVDKITSLEILDETFLKSRPGYTRGDSVMKNGILAEL